MSRQLPSFAPHVDQPALESACTRLGVRLLVLFGSHATGAPPPAPDSDVDLAIAFHHGTPRRSVWECLDMLQGAFPDAVLDVALLADADPLFRWEILREGKLLWGEPLDHLEYRAFAFRDFTDSADLRALERELSDRKLALVRERVRAAP